MVEFGKQLSIPLVEEVHILKIGLFLFFPQFFGILVPAPEW
ncbi:hypothetical protein [Bacillus carboniphilus]